MERLRQLLGQIGAQLGVLTVSQRVAIGLCAAMIVGSLLWLAQWSAAPEMVPLVTREFSFDELDSAESALREEGIAFETRGTRLFVRSVDRYRVLRVLHSAEALPDGSLYDMDAVVSNTSPFLSPEQRRTNETWARGNELAKIIASSPYVRDVRVMITDRSRRHLNRAPLEPSASVTVTLASGKEMRPAMVETFAKLVSGAVAGLEPHNVNVIDATTLRAYNTRHPDDPGGGEYLDQVRQHENHLYRKIMNKLAHIPGAVGRDQARRKPHRSRRAGREEDDFARDVTIGAYGADGGGASSEHRGGRDLRGGRTDGYHGGVGAGVLQPAGHEN